MNDTTLLFAFPFAGGNSYSYNFLKQQLPAHIVLETLEYPGRGKMSAHPLTTDMPALVDILLNQYHRKINEENPRHIAIYGHSIGAVVGLAFLHSVIRGNAPLPRLAFFSGHGAPQYTAKKKLAGLPDIELIAYFESIGSMSGSVIADAELMDYILPILRNDLLLYENYHPQYGDKATIPFTIINGKSDNILQENILSWVDETKGAIKFHQLNGHHFFISQHPQAFAEIIIRDINNILYNPS